MNSCPSLPIMMAEMLIALDPKLTLHLIMHVGLRRALFRSRPTWWWMP